MAFPALLVVLAFKVSFLRSVYTSCFSEMGSCYQFVVAPLRVLPGHLSKSVTSSSL